ncbi:epsin-3-like isoform X2 [Conger conger]|uniref:epsin-3-like isoform X2 n=1 Tax=Conger conger TaxID=82655 RepID=UPI002A59A921|nr:epsin-3-like isoform X2 [Conger conger]
MMTSSLRRQMKNMVNNYTEAEVKVREATSNDPWEPPGPLMEEISDLTFNAVAFPEVMGIIWKRLNDHGKNWRHVYKALSLLEYLIKTGSDRVGKQCRENAVALQTLRDFQHTDRDGRDQGAIVRDKARQVVALLRDEDRLKRARSQSLKSRERAACSASAGEYGDLPPPYPGRRSSQPAMGTAYGGERARGSPSFSSSFSSPRCLSDLEEARPQTSGEEELQLQLALAMSQEESGKPKKVTFPPPVDSDERTQLQMALNLSQEEPVQSTPPIPSSVEMDEDTQLQLALSLSKAAHQEEQLSRAGEETLLRKALEESKREMDGGGEESAMKDLADIFGPGAAAPLSVDPWDQPPPWAKPANVVTSDPWDSLGDRSTTPVIDNSWMGHPAAGSPLKPWDPSQPPPAPWDAPRNISTTIHTDGDLFGEPGMGAQLIGRKQSSPEPFDLSRLREGLADPTPRTSRTPESFLDPTVASLVNLDSLIPYNPTATTTNPFLTEPSASVAPNPFQSELPRLTLNQMRPDSPSSLPSSSSLPPSFSLQPPILPSSFTHPPTFPPSQGLLDVLPSLPQPLLPLSTVPPSGQQGDQQAQNPFL